VLGIAAGTVLGVHATGSTTSAAQAITTPATDPAVVFGGRGGYAWDPRTAGGYGSAVPASVARRPDTADGDAACGRFAVVR
jgi:hypothetical protein